MKNRVFAETLGLLWAAALVSAACAQPDAQAELDAPSQDSVSMAEPAPARESDDGDAPKSDVVDGHRWHGRGSSEMMVRVGSDVTVRAGEEIEQLVVILGSATVDGKVDGDVVVVAGNARVNGEISGNLVVPFGSAELGPEAVVRGDVVVVLGGDLQLASTAEIRGDRIEFTWAMLEEKAPFLGGIRDWTVKGLLWARPFPHQWGWWWWAAFAAAVVYLFTGLVLARPVSASAEVVGLQPVGSFFMGLLGWVLLCVVILLLTATGIGLLVVPFVICGAVVIALVGKVAVFQFIGLQFGRQLGGGVLARPFVALLVGILICYVVFMIPIMGFLLWGLIAPLGTGAALLAIIRAFRREPGSQPAPRASLPPVGLAAPAAFGETVFPAGPPAAPAASVVPTVPPVIPEADEVSELTALETQLRAGFWIRVVATALDLALVLAVISAVGLQRYFLVCWIVYHVAMWAWKATTIGGVVFGLKVVRRDGRPLDFPVALVRSLSALLSALALFLGFFWVGWTRERLSWHDLIAGTAIVRVPRGVPLL